MSISADHDVTVPIFDVNRDRLHLCITTRNLISAAYSSPMLQTDMTFKLNWHQYPGIVLGSQD
jgi:hypothetical protein